MIYVSSSCVRAEKISDSVRQLATRGYRNIELSGGTNHYDGVVEDLIALREEHDLSYRCHNYFPPPTKHFVLNLASADAETRLRSLDHVKKALEICKQLDSSAYSVHAGFMQDIRVSEVGKRISARNISSPEAALARFTDSIHSVTEILPKSIAFFVENNVLSRSNYQSFNCRNPFLMTRANEILAALKTCRVKLLLDVAHLKVSAQSHEISLEKELDALLPVCDYVHISDNDGLADSNQPLLPDSSLYEMLHERKEWLRDKLLTVEVYSGVQDIDTTASSLEAILHA